MKRVAISQSNYIPWKGYFDLIHDVDVFLFYDDVQFTNRDWRNRNLVKMPGGPRWLTIPVGANRDRLIRDVTVDDPRWQRKHWRTLVQWYGKAPFFGDYAPFLAEIYLEREWRTLSALNQFLIQRIAREFLGMRTPLHRTCEFPGTGRNQERLLSLLQAVGADVYISGPAAKAYLDEARFREHGIHVIWKDYTGYPEYPQFHPPFQHAVTILDLLFHTGPDAPFYIWGWRESPPPRSLASAPPAPCKRNRLAT
ncbi:MAG: WbqC family protein [Candidatus Binatia bacterium]